MASQRMRIFAFDYQGPAHLSAGLWRHPKDQGANYKNLAYWTEYAKLLEQARFDGIFFADNVGYHDIYEATPTRPSPMPRRSPRRIRSWPSPRWLR